MIKIYLLLSFSLFLNSFVFAAPAAIKDSLKIRDCFVPLPQWWNEIEINLPDSITSLQLLTDYSDQLKTDILSGNKAFIKAMFLGLQKLNVFPAYAGDAYFDIGNYDEALIVYKKILLCTANEKGRSDEWECCLYYKIGKCYDAKKDRENALTWYRLAIATRFEKGNSATVAWYDQALCAYRCLMNIRCDY